MAVIEKKQIMEQLKTLFGDNNSDEVLSFVEDVSDTFDELQNKAKGDGKDWKAEYEKNDAEWRQRYKDRFFSGTDNSNETDNKLTNDNPDTEHENETEKPSYKFEDLFNPENGKE